MLSFVFYTRKVARFITRGCVYCGGFLIDKINDVTNHKNLIIDEASCD